MQPDRRLALEGIRRVLVVRLDNIGDVVLLGPALRALRSAVPSADITLLVSPAGSQVAPMLPWVDRVIVHRAVWQDAGNAPLPLDPAREVQFIERLKKEAFDAAFIFTSFSQSPWPPACAAYLAGVPIRAGQSKDFGGSLLTHSVKPLDDAVHQAERNLHLLEACGIPVADRSLQLRVPPDAWLSAVRRLGSFGITGRSRFLLLAPGASCPARRYPADRFAQVASLLLKRTRLPIVVVGHPREADEFEPITRLDRKRVFSLVGRISVPELAAVIRRSTLVIANDSGPMHIADAFRRPMVILFSGTEHETQWAPRSSPAAVLLRRPTDCSPCYEFQCPFAMECLDISPEQVAAEALKLIDLRNKRESSKGSHGGRESKEYRISSCVHCAS